MRLKKGRVEFKMDKTANVAIIVVGKRSAFLEEQLVMGTLQKLLNTCSR